MDFGALPPEVNSGRMYSGPGSAPLRAASAAWNLLAAELEQAATGYQSTIDTLADDEWRGPTSASMVAAVDPYITWMNTTAAKAGHTASQASAAATAYETAHAMTVPPPLVAANRAQLAMLVATNVLGQNTAAIAANEAQYGEMWAQDAAAMYGYAASSASAASVQHLTPPPETAKPTAAAQQGSAVAQATSTSAGAGVQSQLQQLISGVPSSLNQLTSPVSAATNPQGWLGRLLDFLDGADGNSIGTFLNSSFVNGFVSGSYVSPAIVTPAITSGLADINSLNPAVESAPGGTGVTGMITPAAVPAPAPVSVPNVGVSVNTSGSTLVGKLSVPPTWTAAAQVANHSGVTYAGGGWTNAVGPAGGGTEAVPAGMPGMPGASAARSGGFGHGPRYGNRLTVMGRPLSGG
ncbi:type VII secretion system ESX-5 target PPE26 [Mycobacterium cookii]|uniref:PPE family protein PPE26 n=1 Tax=Mycobacterium cookii TaxID=1775 RepID=A0A7I7L109_9MYCO|nr:PPE family protein [Mycobacterium cookii]MCV7333289.1 PPE family protein [Mycobacterium cookii]BBX47696.1 PPE family protein PPE26 [Mycobacterium cookii]